MSLDAPLTPATGILRHEFVEITEYVGLVQNYRSTEGWNFRGQIDRSWPLRPKAGRPEYFCKDMVRREPDRHQVSGDLTRFERWRDFAIAVRDPLPKNDFDCLAYAQHYGLATRLLDWTTNPLVALFFATEDGLGIDGGVFCHFPVWQIARDSADIFSCKGTGRLIPLQFDRRIVAQSGVFTYHYDPREPVAAEEVTGPFLVPPPRLPVGPNLAEITVRADLKVELQARLAELGITRKTLFPDLEGVSAYVNWGTKMDNIYRR